MESVNETTVRSQKSESGFENGEKHAESRETTQYSTRRNFLMEETMRNPLQLEGDSMEYKYPKIRSFKSGDSKSTATGFLPEGEASSSTEMTPSRVAHLLLPERRAVEALLMLQHQDFHLTKQEDSKRLSTDGAFRRGEQSSRQYHAPRNTKKLPRRKTKSVREVIKLCKQGGGSVGGGKAIGGRSYAAKVLECSRQRAKNRHSAYSVRKKERKPSLKTYYPNNIHRRAPRKLKSLNFIVESFKEKSAAYSVTT